MGMESLFGRGENAGIGAAGIGMSNHARLVQKGNMKQQMMR